MHNFGGESLYCAGQRWRLSSFHRLSWHSIVIKEELGSGTFGSVYFAISILLASRGVVVKINRKTKQRFEKEAGVLDSVKGHKNIARFLRFCQEPQAIMMEYWSAFL